MEVREIPVPGICQSENLNAVVSNVGKLIGIEVN